MTEQPENIETIDIDFQKALTIKIKEGGWGAQAELARHLKKAPSYINGIIKGRHGGSESEKRKIANFYGFKYEDFLTMGRGEINVRRLHENVCCRFLSQHPEANSIIDALIKAAPRCDEEKINQIVQMIGIICPEQAAPKKAKTKAG